MTTHDTLHENEAALPALSPAALPALSPAQKRALLARLLQDKAERVRTAPVSLGQERLWFLAQIDPRSPAYNIPIGLHVRGGLGCSALARTLELLELRHETLRTCFGTVNGLPTQEIHAAGRPSLPIIDLRRLPAEQREPLSRRLATFFISQPFDLGRRPLWRSILVRLEDDDHKLMISLHHAICDEWSLGIFTRELSPIYAALLAGETASLPPLPVQYADYARWQRRWVESGALAASLAYWREQLREIPVLDLPTDRPRPAVQRLRGERFRVELPEAAVDTLRQLGRLWGATLFMSVLAVFQALLGRLSGQLDVAVGSPMAGRDRVETEGLIGFFVNMVVLRTDLAGDPSFAELVARVRQTVSGGLVHQAVPFEKLVAELQLRRDTSRNPLFQVAFILLTVNPHAQPLPGTEVSEVELGNATSKFDLSFYFIDAFEQPRVSLEYNGDLFDKTTALRFGAAFCRLLEVCSQRPEARLGELSTLSAHERWQLLGEWNDTALELPPAGCVCTLFAARAAEHPEREAIVAGRERLSYGELDRRSNRLARALRRLGVGPEQTVAVALERDGEMIVALLAVLKAGGAYVALDPAYPAPRRAAIAVASGARVALTRSHLLDHALETVPTVVCLDRDLDLSDPTSETALAPVAAGERLAYLLFTSGSTGEPKGVAICHASVWAFVLWAREVFAPGELAGVLASTSINFDLSVFEIFVPLCWGGRIVLAENALALPSLETAGEVTLINTVPSALARLLEDGGLPPALRTLNLAGEPIPPALVRRVLQTRPEVRLYNLYGPSEDTTYSTFTRLTLAEGSPPIGRPIAGSRARLLDRRLCPAPLGTVAELYLGGAGLARGYLGRPALTAERFLPDPEGTPGQRLYRTGDLARYRTDGRLEFLGRLDHQVKVRGFRIELGEIETTLEAHPQIRRAAVVAVGEGETRKLVAYCTSVGEPLPSPETLRAFVLERLPTFMVPAAFVALGQLPLNANGKVDRRALGRIETIPGHDRASYVAPENDLETAVSEIWRELLGVERVGVHDSFFDLGGTSMLIPQLNLRLEQRLGRTLPVLTLFNHPTPRDLARYLRDGDAPPSAGHPRTERSGTLGAAKDRLRHRLLVERNDPASSAPLAANLHELFAEQAARTPEAVAVALDGLELRHLSYGALARRAGALARALRTLGVGTETRVALLAERSLEMVVATLAILEAGGAYVPLDPGYPAERLESLLADSRALLVLAQRDLLGRVAGTPALVLEDVLAETAALAPATATPRARVEATQLAYVMYTSGSTGRPKGVAVSHQGVVRLVCDADYVHLGPSETVLQAAPAAFDAATFEIWAPLLNGGRLVLAPAEQLDPTALGRTIERQRVSTLWLTAGLFQLLVETELPRLRGVRQLLTGGDVVSPSHARRVLGELPGTVLINGYGPTENTTFTCCCSLRGPADLTATVPIGRPIGATWVYLLAPGLVLAPAGEPGHLATAGAGLARGYLARPAATAAVFVPDPWSARPGGRLYLTGDLARQLPDGRFEFLGRLDRQVKIRGFRIEPAEIEHALAALAGVAAAAVVTTRGEGAGGETRLLGFAVPALPGALDAQDLRAALAARLPAPCVPQTIALVETLPLTPNGKVDRAALAALAAIPIQPAEAHAPPRAPLEQTLASWVAALLGGEPVSVHDNLFALGAHSLVMARLLARLRRDLGVEVSLRELYENPTLEALARLIATRREVPRLPPFERAPRDQPIPLSFPQERVWFLDQLVPGNIAYNFQGTLRLRGPLALGVLRATLAEIVRRHEVLRTRFPVRDGRPVQEILPSVTLEVPLVDLGALPAGVRETAAETVVRREIRRPFDLLRAPLIRFTVLRLSALEHLVIQVEHHFVHDGWSLAVLLGEIEAIYPALAAGRPSPLPLPSAHCADFAVWQRGFMSGPALERHLELWHARLAGSPPALTLPTDRPRPKLQSFVGSALEIALPPALGAALRGLCRRQGLTLFALMTGGFAALLHRFGGDRDLLIGTAVANRRLRELESMLGMAVNTVILRLDLGGRPSAETLFARTAATVFEALELQDVPLDRLVERLAPERDLARNPLFQVMFSFHDSPVPDLVFGDLQGELRLRHNGSAKADLNVVVVPRAEQRIGRGTRAGEDGVLLIWEYATALFDRTTMQRMVASYRVLLAGAAADPTRPIAELPLLAPAERQQLSFEHNDTLAPTPAGVVEQVEAMAESFPAALAVTGGGAELSYAALETAANRLAHRLRRLGAGPERVVATLLPRSPALVVAQLAALKAGAAFSPLDPSHPRARLAPCLEDPRLAAVVVFEEPIAELPPTPAAVVALDPALACLAGEDPGRLAAVTWAESLAYVIYTSGTTGRPKGVELTLGGLANLVGWHLRAHPLSRYDRATLVASPAFDASVWELWPALAAGASLHVPAEPLRLMPAELAAWLARERITFCFLPTPLAEAFCELEPPAELKVRTLGVGGDRMRRAPRRRLPFRLLNLYGPTEVTVVTAAGDIPAGPEVGETPSIGRPIANLSVSVLDAELRCVPLGALGELYAGGRGLARGYLGQPGLTAARFLPDPFAGPVSPGARLYRTGDLARYRTDGRLDCLGRLDHQLKVRGHRVELGEIEAQLLSHPGIVQAVVHADGEERALVAHVVAGTPAPTAEQLRRFLLDRLPAAIVPVSWFFHPVLPLAATGKVDRAALGRAALGRAALGRAALTAQAAASTAGEPAAQRAPTTATEQLLAEVWSQLLGGREIGTDDDFFALGGHSLLATRAAARVRELFAVELPLTTFFEHPTIAGLAAQVDRAQPGVVAVPPIVPLSVPGDAQGAVELPLSFAQERLWFIERLVPGQTAYLIARALRLRGRLSPPALAAALAEVVRRHPGLRTCVVTREGQPRQTIAAPSGVELPVVDLAALPAERRATVAAAVARTGLYRRFDLGRPPLVRALLVRLDAGEHVLGLCVHHLAADGGSLPIVLRELALGYAAALEDRSPVLPALAVQPADWALWQRGWLCGEVLERQVALWRRRLEGAPAVLQLPTDHPRPPRPTLRGRICERRLGAALHGALGALGRARGATLPMVLLAGFQVLLARLSGQRDVVVGVDVAGRHHPELENLVGLLVNQLVLRLDLRDDPTLATVIERVRRGLLEALGCQDLPFEKLVEELRPEREVGRNPLFQAMFVFLDRPAEPPALAGLTSEWLPLGVESSAFDLSLLLVPLASGELETRLRYSTDLFEPATAERLLRQYEIALEALVRDPAARALTLDLLSESEKERAAMSLSTQKQSSLGKLMSARPRRVTLDQEQVVRSRSLDPGRILPLVIEPVVEGVDLAAWAHAYREWLDRELTRCGGLLLRGFGVENAERFHEVVRAVCGEILEYGERSSPRSAVVGRIYTSTDHPPDQPIVLHNEQSYTLRWPLKICFGCLEPARTGGATPIADSRAILRRLDPAIVESFERRHVLYVRNYGTGLGLPWQQVFGTEDRAEVEGYCRAAAIDVEWLAGDRLRTRQRRRAVHHHPKTGERTWFNHALFFHVTSLEPTTREALLASFAEADLPTNSYYGDGAPIEPATLLALRAAYREETLAFPWQRGDLLLLDNMLTAHGRDPFEGPRRVVVAMAEPIEATPPQELGR